MSDLETALISLAASIVTGGIALLGVSISNRENTKRLNIQLQHELNESNKSLLREKAEELYELTDDWLKGLFYNFINLTYVMKGEFDYNQYLDQMIKHGEKSKGNFTKLEMIMHVYFQNLLPTYKNVLKHREEVNDIISAHKKDYEKGRIDGNKYLDNFIKKQLLLEESCEALKLEIAKCARNA